MPERLLHIDASPRGERSRSRDIAAHYLKILTTARPGIEVEQLDLWAIDLPDLGDGMIEGRYALIMGDEVAPDIADAWDVVGQHAAHFLKFDSYLISTPMWNFGIPYRLKHFVDVVTQPGMAFTNDAEGHVIGHGAGKRATIIAASAMDIRPDGPLAAFDFQLGYLVTWLRFIGLDAISTLRVAPTYGPVETVEAAMGKGRRDAARLALDQASDAARV